MPKRLSRDHVAKAPKWRAWLLLDDREMAELRTDVLEELRKAHLQAPKTQKAPTKSFVEALRERKQNLLTDTSPEGRRRLLSLALPMSGSTAEVDDALRRGRRTAEALLDAMLTVTDPAASTAEVEGALEDIDKAHKALTGAEHRTRAQAELISSISQAAKWVREDRTTVEVAAPIALKWFEKTWPIYAAQDTGPAFRSAVDAWLRRDKTQWPATATAVKAAGIMTSAENAKKTWHRWKPADAKKGHGKSLRLKGE